MNKRPRLMSRKGALTALKTYRGKFANSGPKSGRQRIHGVATQELAPQAGRYFAPAAPRSRAPHSRMERILLLHIKGHCIFAISPNLYIYT